MGSSSSRFTDGENHHGPSRPSGYPQGWGASFLLIQADAASRHGLILVLAPMMKTALLLTALVLSPSLMACDLSLVGTWQSDATATMSFNRANAKLEERQERFLTSLMGKMTLEFTDKQIYLRSPDTQVAVNGELKPFAGFEERNPYKVLFCNDRMVVIETPEAVTGEISVTTYFFVNADAMWAYAGSNSPKVPDLHIREYFIRVR